MGIIYQLSTIETELKINLIVSVRQVAFNRVSSDKHFCHAELLCFLANEASECEMFMSAVVFVQHVVVSFTIASVQLVRAKTALDLLRR